jgi:hypothetical protein
MDRPGPVGPWSLPWRFQLLGTPVVTSDSLRRLQKFSGLSACSPEASTDSPSRARLGVAHTWLPGSCCVTEGDLITCSSEARGLEEPFRHGMFR